MSRRLRDTYRLTSARVGNQAVALPLLVVIATYVCCVVAAPDIDDATQVRWTSFFGTAAQVTATLLVVLVIEARLVVRTRAFERLGGASFTVICVAVGLVAAGAGLSPGLSGGAYLQAFAFASASGVGALLGVVLIGLRALSTEYDARDRALEERVNALFELAEEVRLPPAGPAGSVPPGGSAPGEPGRRTEPAP